MKETDTQTEDANAVRSTDLLCKSIQLRRRRDKLIKFKKDNYHETYELIGERGGQINTPFGDRVDARIQRATNSYIETLECLLEIPKHNVKALTSLPRGNSNTQ